MDLLSHVVFLKERSNREESEEHRKLRSKKKDHTLEGEKVKQKIWCKATGN
jgi:hypothetical protein